MASRTALRKAPGKHRAAAQDPIDLIVEVNRGRVPELLQRKFEAMAEDRFAFLRATAMLGHRAVDLSALPPVPVAWVCGDLHLQNFGCFRGGNRLVYFDLNDFDEAACLPVVVDLLRFLGSIYTAAPGLGLERPSAQALVALSVESYARALARGKAFWLERETARGPIAALLAQVEERKRRSLLAARTHLHDGGRRLNVDGTRYLAVPGRDPVRAQLARALDALAERFGDREFFRERDIAFRVAGMGSLGVPRYVVLVRGKGDPDRNALIDFKRAEPSSAAAALPQFPQPAWTDEAQRVAHVQDLCQAASPAYLCALDLGTVAFVARELQPVEDKMALAPLVRHIDRLDETLASMAKLSAYAQLRGAGRRGADSADALIAFGQALLAQPAPWIEAARAVDAANSAAYVRFRAAWRAGEPRLHALCAPPQARAPARTPVRKTGKAAKASGAARAGGARRVAARKKALRRPAPASGPRKR